MREDIKYYAKLAQHALGPVAGQVEVCSACFQKCAGCRSWREEAEGTMKGHWSGAKLFDLCLQLEKYKTFEHLTLTGGDPQAWRDLTSFLNAISKSTPRSWRLQVSTALMKRVDLPLLWREALDAVRVSLDAVDCELYKKIRGVDVDPHSILENAVALGHTNLAFITTVYPETVEHMHAVAKAVNDLQCNEIPVRRHIFLPMLGNGKHTKQFWRMWDFKRRSIEADFPQLRTSFGETLKPEHIDPSVRCWIGNVGFHLKSNGDYYSCCLAGGEALETNDLFKVGNYYKADADFGALYQAAVESGGCRCYGNSRSPCREICQRKQYDFNRLRDVASHTRLAIP